MKKIEDMTEPELRELTTRICRGVSEKLPAMTGFCVLFWPIGTHNVAQYGSNCHRVDMVTALRETADRLERREDVPR